MQAAVLLDPFARAIISRRKYGQEGKVSLTSLSSMSVPAVSSLWKTLLPGILAVTRNAAFSRLLTATLQMYELFPVLDSTHKSAIDWQACISCSTLYTWLAVLQDLSGPHQLQYSRLSLHTDIAMMQGRFPYMYRLCSMPRMMCWVLPPHGLRLPLFCHKRRKSLTGRGTLHSISLWKIWSSMRCMCEDSHKTRAAILNIQVNLTSQSPIIYQYSVIRVSAEHPFGAVWHAVPRKIWTWILYQKRPAISKAKVNLKDKAS